MTGLGDVNGTLHELLPTADLEETSPPNERGDRKIARKLARANARERDAEKRQAEHHAAGDRDFSGPIVQLEEVTRFFPGPPKVFALRGIDLTIERGDYLAIVGASGSGKSTMLNALGLLDRPSTGRFLFEGIDTADLNEDERSALRGNAIGFVFQSFHLLPTRTVLENVMLAASYAGVPKAERESLARESLTRVGLAHRIDFFPNRISGGERQRVAIARAVCTSPRLLLADEPTGNLDRQNSEIVMRLFEELGEEGLTIVMITHDESVAASARRRVRMQDGELSVIA